MGLSLGSTRAANYTPLWLYTGVGGVRAPASDELYPRECGVLWLPVGISPRDWVLLLKCPEVWLLSSGCCVASSKGILQGYLENEKKEGRKTLFCMQVLSSSVGPQLQPQHGNAGAYYSVSDLCSSIQITTGTERSVLLMGRWGSQSTGLKP